MRANEPGVGGSTWSVGIRFQLEKNKQRTLFSYEIAGRICIYRQRGMGRPKSQPISAHRNDTFERGNECDTN